MHHCLGNEKFGSTLLHFSLRPVLRPFSSEASSRLFLDSVAERLQAVLFYNRVGGDNQVVTFSSDRRFVLVYIAEDI